MRRTLITRLAVLAAIAGSLVIFGPASPANASIGLYRASAVSVLNANLSKSITVGCNNVNDRIINVGGRINDGFGDVLMPRAFVNPGLTLATVWGIEAIPTAVPWSVEVFVTCAPPGAIAGLVLVENTAGPSVNDKFPQALCPIGKKVFGGGYYLDNANGLVAIDEFSFDPNLTYARATAYNYGVPASYSFTVQAICGTQGALAMSRTTFLSANNALSPKTVTTNNCPVNTQVSAVGTIITGALGNASIDMLNPRPQLLAGESTVREIGAYAGNWTSQVEAICVG